MRRAVYAGSFDPITNGHLWMIEEGAKLFDELAVAIGVNNEKQYTFSLGERMAALREAVQGIANVTVESFENDFLVNYADHIGAQFVLRGIRNYHDYEYERGMRHINSDLQGGVTTVFLMPPREISEVSSSLVKSLIGPEGWRDMVRRYVPQPVFDLLVEKYGRK